MSHAPRPGYRDATVVAEACKATVAALVQGGMLESRNANEACADIASCADYMMDGYELAKALEICCGWQPSAQMVAQLDDHSLEWSQAHSAAVKGWVQQYGITAPHQVGARVVVPWRHGTQPGAIERILPAAAEYYVKLDIEREKERWVVVPYEAVTALPSGT